MGKIARYLNQLIIGNVFDTPDILESYSTDRSILKIKPRVVAFPESTEDVRKLLKFCYQLALKDIDFPVAIRGSGLDEMGADLSTGLVISTEKLNRLLESDRRERLVRVQAGITLKELNTALSLNGTTIPIGGHDSETIGGLISNCPADDYSGKYGGIMNYVERVEVVLANGDILQTNRLGNRLVARKAHEKTLEGGIYRKLSKLLEDDAEVIDKIRRNNGGLCGYPNITRVSQRKSLDVLPLFFGAEGTLGVITEVILRSVPIEPKARRVVATFEDLRTAQKFLEVADSFKPRELNIYDMKIAKLAEESGKKLSAITSKLETGFVVFASYDRRSKACLKKIEKVKSILPRSSQLFLESEKNCTVLDEFENSLTSFLNQVRTGERMPIVSDFYLPAENLRTFYADLEILKKSLKLDLYLYGSYAASNYSIRPKFKPEDEEFDKKVLAFLRAGNLIINRQEGSITGGSPEGRVKAIVTNIDMPEAEKKLYAEIKKIFDRYGILGGDIKLGADPRFTVKHFRTTGANKIVV